MTSAASSLRRVLRAKSVLPFGSIERNRSSESASFRTVCASSVEEMVNDYAEQIRRVQPFGPYHLCGWSFGGIIAHALATHLQALGQEVAFLGLLDTIRPTNHVIEINQTSLNRFLTVTATQTLLNLGFDANSISDELVDRIVRVVSNNYELLEGHRTGVFQRHMLFVHATIPSPGLIPESSFEEIVMTWQPFVTGDIDYVEMQVSHFKILEGKSASQLAEVFNVRLADSTSPRGIVVAAQAARPVHLPSDLIGVRRA